MAASKKTWIVAPHIGDKYELAAETYSHDPSTGQHIFTNGDERVATLYNVSVVDKAAVTPAP